MSTRYFVDRPLAPGPVEIRGAEAHHLVAVSRVRPGDQVFLFNGDGHEYPARVLEVSRRCATLNVIGIETPARELGFRLEVAAPLPKGDRGQFMVEKLTELGVTHYSPIRAERSQSHSAVERAGKLRQYVIEASKQCGRNVLMSVAPVTDWLTYCKSEHLPKRKILAHPLAEVAASEMFAPPHLPLDCALAVGPEGGFTEEEALAAREAGWTVASLGPRMLRVETAALTLAALAAVRTGGLIPTRSASEGHT
jgi:16S rRNA (uracil1498-N3)-methyltransferase